jgi:hypothetical protein
VVFAWSGRVDGLMTNSDEYRRRAGECLLFAQYVTGEMSRNLLLRMAFGWNDLAERADQQKSSADRADRGEDKSRT